jgi:hypothetical protein
MKKILIILGIILALLVIVLGVRAIFFHPPATQPGPKNQDPFGFSSSTPSTATNPGQSNKTLLLKLGDGSVVSVPNFIDPSQPSWATPSQLLVAGDPAEDFLITYIPADSQSSLPEFIITLQNEPLGATRLEVEDVLRNKLRLTDKQLCLLNVSIETAPGLSETYDGRQLGLSFCSGAVKLP